MQFPDPYLEQILIFQITMREHEFTQLACFRGQIWRETFWQSGCGKRPISSILFDETIEFQEQMAESGSNTRDRIHCVSSET